jgi:hypothetical protein
LDEPFPIQCVPGDVDRLDESLGTKPKFWWDDPAGGAPRHTLFKQGRPNEDWSEKLAACLAETLGLPRAQVHLASHQGKRGICSPSFVPDGANLAHGNELLGELDPSYPVGGHKVPAHTVPRVVAALVGAGVAPSPALQSTLNDGADQLVGYLLLDAWIGNTDRHHENWGVLQRSGDRVLAPTYDHATSLGRELTQAKAALRLSTRDRNQTVDAYAARARSAFFGDPPARGTITTLAALLAAAELRPGAARYWAARLEGVPPDVPEGLVARVPAALITTAHRELAVRLLAVNRARILDALE